MKFSNLPSIFRHSISSRTRKISRNIKLDDKYPFHNAHGRLTYDLHDKKWVPHIRINNLSNCKADTKNKKYYEILWKIQQEKVQLTRDLPQ